MATHSSILAWEIPWTEGPEVEREIIIPRVRLTASLLSLSPAPSDPEEATNNVKFSKMAKP